MAYFVATYINRQGNSALVDIEATDLIQAKRSLRLRGIRATEIKVKANGTATSSSAATQLQNKLKFSKLNELLEAKPGIKEKAVCQLSSMPAYPLSAAST
jgi:type IV pilus assembly protein PilC